MTDDKKKKDNKKTTQVQEKPSQPSQDKKGKNKGENK